MEVELEMEEFCTDDQRTIENEMKIVKMLNLKKQLSGNDSDVYDSDDEVDKENQNNQNFRRRVKKKKKKPVGIRGRQRTKSGVEGEIELYNDEIICEKMGRLFKKTQNAPQKHNTAPQFETVLVESQYSQQHYGLNSQRRRKKKLSKYDKIKQTILQDQEEEDYSRRSISRSKSRTRATKHRNKPKSRARARKAPIEDEDLLQDL